jgi:hypothetical protein
MPSLKQPSGIGMLGIGEYALGRSELHDPAEIHHGNAMAQEASDQPIKPSGDVLRAAVVETPPPRPDNRSI